MTEERESLQPAGYAIIIQCKYIPSTQCLESVNWAQFGYSNAVICTDQDLVFTTMQYLPECFSLTKSTGEDIEIVAFISSHNGTLIIIPGSGEPVCIITNYGVYPLPALGSNTRTQYIIMYAKDYEEAASLYNQVYVQNQEIH